jgi:GH24 family phage-related lysozyme (muramidase)
VTQGLVITQQEADRLFDQDIRRFEVGVENSLARHATQQQFDAMVSLAYNIGINAFRKSTLLQRFNEGDHDAVITEWKRWNKAGDKVLEGLTRRRQKEIDHYTRA